MATAHAQIVGAARAAASSVCDGGHCASSKSEDGDDESRGPHWFSFSGPVLATEAQQPANSHPFSRSSVDLHVQRPQPSNASVKLYSRSDPGLYLPPS